MFVKCYVLIVTPFVLLDVEIKVIASFQRMQKFGDSPEAIEQAIIIAIRNSAVLELDEPRKLVRRRSTFLDRKTVEAQTIYTTGFAQDANRDHVNAFFAQYGTVVCMRMIRSPSNNSAFLESVFVMFDSAAKAQQVSTMSLTYGKSTLNMMMRADYEHTIFVQAAQTKDYAAV